MGKLVLVMSVAVLALSAGDASAHLRKAHHKHGNPYPVLSYSVPQWGPYSGYAYYDDGYPIYLDHVRPYVGSPSTYQPNATGYADLSYGCCGSAQQTRVTGSPTRGGTSLGGLFGLQRSTENE